MNVAAKIATLQPVGVSSVNDAEELQVFRDPACAAALWQREMPADVEAWLAGLDPAVLPNARVVVPTTAVKEVARQLCDLAKMPEGPHLDWLVQDISELANNFAVLMGCDHLRLRLQAISTNACRKFHRDAITGRLVCTYRGRGTQYGTSVEGADPMNVFNVSTGVPVLLRGSLWPPTPAAGLLHRSPPIEGTGETRLVLVLDPVSGPEEDE